MNTKYVTLAIILLFISIAAYGQKENTIPIVKEELTLIQCRKMAIENNKHIAIADRDKDKSTATMQAYRTNFLPRFSAFGLGYYTHSTSDLKLRMGDINLFDPNDFSGVVPPSMMPVLNELSVVSIPDMNFRLKLNNTYVAGISVEQPIYMGGKITSAYRMSKIGEEIAGLNRILTESEVILETDRAYWLCVQAVELRKSAAKYQEVICRGQIKMLYFRPN